MSKIKRLKRKTGDGRNLKIRMDELDAVMDVIIDSVNKWSGGVNSRLAAIEEKLGIETPTDPVQETEEGEQA